MNLLSIFHKEEHEDGVEYHVRADFYAGGEYDLVFSKRMDAAEYKKSLRKSKRDLKATITRREYRDGFIVNEAVI